MALPVILVDSATGSDSTASGAGPATALTGSAASTDGAGTVVTLDGSPDLSGVATDGSHVIYLADSTAGNRNFGKITAKDNSAKTVTVANAFGASLSGKSWAIGGKRASLFGTNSAKLLENNAAAGDAQNGWIVEFKSGHSESTGGTFYIRTGVSVRTEAGYSTRALLTHTANAALLVCFSSDANVIVQGLEFRNTHGTKTNSRIFGDNYGGSGASSSQTKLIDCVASHATDNFTYIFGGRNAVWAESCIFTSVSHAIVLNATAANVWFSGCHFKNCGGSAFTTGGGRVGVCYAFGCVFEGCGDDVLSIYDGYGGQQAVLIHCTFYGNAGDGAYIGSPYGSGTPVVVNCIFENNGGYGLNLDTASSCACIRNNVFHGNTSGTIYNSPGSPGEMGSLTVDPDFVNASGSDFTPQEATLEGTAFPLSVP